MGDNTNAIFKGVQMGLGTWAWGDRLFWGYGKGYTVEDVNAAFKSSISLGITLMDTAEIYGQGKSEQILGRLLKDAPAEIKVATKFMPFPWRLNRRALLRALKGSLKRLDLPRVDLYQIHFPLPPINIETWMEAMAEAVQAGLTSAVGVSNFDRSQMQRAYDTLAHLGVCLASNQVEYHLLNRRVEKAGLLKACNDLGVTLISYSPLAQGLLTGKYTPDHLPGGMRGNRTGRKYLQKIQPLIHLLNRLGSDHGGKTPGQISLNWLLCKGTFPIPGAKNSLQAEQNAGALGWRLSDEEVAALDAMSDQVTSAKE